MTSMEAAFGGLGKKKIDVFTPSEKVANAQQEQPKRLDRNREWDKTEPTAQIEGLASDLERLGEHEGTIIDAGAGLGRNALFLADQGFSVEAIEKDKRTANELKKRAQERDLEAVTDREILGSVHVTKGDMVRALKKQRPGSVVAVVDSGASHYFGTGQGGPDSILKTGKDRKKEFSKAVFRALKPGGLFALLHFSKSEKTVPELGEYEQFLKSFYQEPAEEVMFEEFRPWQEITWESDMGEKHSAWTVTLRKPGGPPTSQSMPESEMSDQEREEMEKRFKEKRDKRAQESTAKTERILLELWDIVKSLREQGVFDAQEIIDAIKLNPNIQARKNNPTVQRYLEGISDYFLSKRTTSSMDQSEFLEASHEILDLEPERAKDVVKPKQEYSGW